MSMLAEKKRSTKWQLNPRGKSLLENPNFGKQLLEKMGWKSGQGLGANNQGPTDIVKVKLKNDSEGLGFKKTDNEWLKTTSEFGELLDRLSNDTAEESSDQNQSSLEDRSKNSKSRVHYHKFTRGKDLSRYSTKDLSSIIGPDLMKPKIGNEHSDYTSNQVNSGSSEDYFNKKKKHETSSKTNLNSDDTEENDKGEKDEISQVVDGVDVCKSKKKGKKSKQQNELSVQYNENVADIESPVDVEKVQKKKNKEINIIPTEHVGDSDALHSIDNGTEQRKRHKKQKHDEFVEDLQECISSEQNIIPTEHVGDSDALHSIDNRTEQRKRHKKRKHNEVVEDLQECISSEQNIIPTEHVGNSDALHSIDNGTEQRKRHKKRKHDEVVEDLQECISSEQNIIPTEHIGDSDALHSIDNGTEQRKRHKKRKHDEVVEDLQECISSEQNIQDVDISSSKKKKKKSVDLNLIASESNNDESIKIVKKKKKKSSKVDVDSSDIQKEDSSIDIDDLSSKKKKDEENFTNTDVQMEELNKEKKKRKKSKTIEDTNISHHGEKQEHGVSVVSEQFDAELDKSGNETKSKKKKSRKNKDVEDDVLPRQPSIYNTYSQHESRNGNKKYSCNKVTVTGNIEKTPVIPQKIDLFTESLLVKHKLSTLGKPIPDVEVILNGEEILQKVGATNAATRKQNLILYYSVNHWKSLLPKREVNEIKLANTLLIKRRFQFIGIVKEGLDQIEATVRSETKVIDDVETTPKKVLSQQKELFSSLLDRLNLLKQQSWDCTEHLTLKKADQGIVDQRLIDKVNQMFKKPFSSHHMSVFNETEHFILSNIPAFLEVKLKRITDLVESLLAGNVPKELTRDLFDENNTVSSNYGVRNGNYGNRSWVNPKLNQSRMGRGGYESRRGQGGFQRGRGYESRRGQGGFQRGRGGYESRRGQGGFQRGRGYESRRGQGGFQGSLSYREHDYSAHHNVQQDNFYFDNQPGYPVRGRGRYHRGPASFQESRRTTFEGNLSYPEAQKENFQHQSAYTSNVLEYDNTYDQARGTQPPVKITKIKKKKGKIFPSTGTHVRFEPLPQEDQPQPEVLRFNAPASFCHFGTVYRRGEGTFRGLFRGRVRQRGSIAQANYDAKQYAEQCKALNKTPEITFNGVDMNKIPGYAASLTPSNTTATDTQS